MPAARTCGSEKYDSPIDRQGVSASSLAPAALFELLAGAAGAGGVAAGGLDGETRFALGQVELELGRLAAGEGVEVDVAGGGDVVAGERSPRRRGVAAARCGAA